MNAHVPPSRLRPFRPVPFGRYTLLAELARGGMGEIYLARIDGPQGFEKLCVIKRILPQLAARADFVARFINEAKTLVKLTHGSIAQVLDMGLHEGEPFLALELIDGKDLRKIAARMRDRGLPIPLTVVLHVFGRVLDALAYAHRKRDDDDRELQLVHRDVSPQNILVSYEGEVKVIDFGLAKSALSTGKTDPNIVLGKFLYMAPEQARHSGTVDRRSDLYSVGLCLYELIHGENPFDGVPPGELMARVSQPQLPPLSQVEPLCPPSVAAMVTRALQPDPALRFQTAEEFRARLQACLIDIDPSAGPESVSRFLREVFASDYQAERRLLASFRESTRPAQQPLLPFKELSSARTVELVPPSGNDVTVPRAPLPLRDVDTRPRAPLPPRDDSDPRAFRDPDTDPRNETPRRPEDDTHPRTDAARFEETSPRPAPGRPGEDTDPRTDAARFGAPPARPEGDTDPRILLGTPLQETQPRVVLGTLLPDDAPAPRRPEDDTDPRTDAARFEETSPRPAPGRPGEDTDPRTDAARFGAPPARPEGDTDPRILLGTPLQETQPRVVLGTLLPDDAPAPRPPGGGGPPRPESPAALGRPAALPRPVSRDQAPTIEWERPDFSAQLTRPHPMPTQPGGRLGWWIVAPVVLLTVGAVAYFLHDMYRSGAFLAERPERAAASSSAPRTTAVPDPALPLAVSSLGVDEDPAQPAVTGAADAHAVRLAAKESAANAQSTATVAATDDDDALDLEPLTAPPPALTREQALLDTEWTRARDAFQALERRRSCKTESMATLCARFGKLREQVERSDGSDADRLVSRIRGFVVAVEAKRAR